MLNKTVFVAALLSLVLASCQSSRPLRYPTGIYRNAAAFHQQQPSLVGAKARTNLFGSKLVVVRSAANGEVKRVKVRADSAWGYADGGPAYRVRRQGRYRGNFQVVQADTLMIYSRLEYVERGRVSIGYYCSAGPTGPVVAFNRRALRRTFADNPAFLRSLAALRWYESVRATTRQPTGVHTYRVVDLYRQSLGLPPAAVPAP